MRRSRSISVYLRMRALVGLAGVYEVLHAETVEL
jgi:hypothetical protein